MFSYLNTLKENRVTNSYNLKENRVTNSYNLKENRVINSYNLKENKSDKFIQSVLYCYTPWGGVYCLASLS